ncbi:hypothetical protein FIE12Z_12822 [Fusarium flagelliforme]|uniref:Short chain dehydrogenase n=1 Tax=Fusarium flagelliforme TaxID=2675880 RepID=A0A395M4Y9_9HYPO|nr:hypothetical protein FIE12Z_12822 [Fusarium flagelliforme]
MATYLITGASRNLGFEFMRLVSKNPDNVVVGIVRNKSVTEDKVAKELPGRTNIHLLEADMTNYESLANTVPLVTKLVNGALDYVIANAGLIPDWSEFKSFEKMAKQPALLEQDLDDCWKTNVVGNVHLFNLYVPLLKAGRVKKVAVISTGLADPGLTRDHNIYEAMPYSISKAAANMLIAKYSAAYAKDGLVFLAICPGSVKNDRYQDLSEEDMNGLSQMGDKFIEYAPHFSGAKEASESAAMILDVINQASLEAGYGGKFLSHHGGNKYFGEPPVAAA